MTGNLYGIISDFIEKNYGFRHEKCLDIALYTNGTVPLCAISFQQIPTAIIFQHLHLLDGNLVKSALSNSRGFLIVANSP